jgi:hypothetical protein
VWQLNTGKTNWLAVHSLERVLRPREARIAAFECVRALIADDL